MSHLSTDTPGACLLHFSFGKLMGCFCFSFPWSFLLTYPLPACLLLPCLLAEWPFLSFSVSPFRAHFSLYPLLKEMYLPPSHPQSPKPWSPLVLTPFLWRLGLPLQPQPWMAYLGPGLPCLACGGHGQVLAPYLPPPPQSHPSMRCPSLLASPLDLELLSLSPLMGGQQPPVRTSQSPTYCPQM
jgi:hypothetical protein